MTATLMEPELVVASGGATAPGATFDEFLTRYQAELYRFALRLTRNRADADDLYQETLIKAYRAFGRLDGVANHRAWLFRIATNAFLSNQRRVRREWPLEEAAEVAVSGHQTDQAARLDAGDLLREVAAFMDRLPGKQRAALVLRKHHGLGYGEIATTLQCSEGAARVKVHAALRKLRDRFGDRLDDGDRRRAEPAFAGDRGPAIDGSDCPTRGPGPDPAGHR
jgi:RNA polymerase sigma-70 factor, ECF subfamily